MSSSASTLVSIAIVVLVYGMTVHSVAVVGPDDAYYEASQQYCEQKLGPEAQLVNSNVFGYGNLHCEGPDKELIHLHNVPDE